MPLHHLFPDLSLALALQSSTWAAIFFLGIGGGIIAIIAIIFAHTNK